MTLWGERRWRFLLNLIEHLPRHSYFVEAYADDDEAAEAAGATPERRIERLSDWTPEREALAELYDLTAALLGVLLKVNGNEPPPMPAFPRPELAVHRLARRRQRALQDRIHDALYPS